jgi:hypothetical protein
MAKIHMVKRGQVTIFIIIAILIVSAILIFLLWVRPTYLSGRSGDLGFEKCVEDVGESEIEVLGLSGGFVNPEASHMYNGEEIPYLCYTEEYYETCVVQKPFLKQHFEEGLKEKIRAQVDACYANSIDNLKAQGHNVKSGDVEYDVLLEPGVVRIEIEAPTTIGSSRLTRFNVKINSPIYEMLMLATSILQYEVSFGDSDIDSLMFLHSGYIIDKIRRGDGTKIYVIEDKLFHTKFQFASKSLLWPAGYPQ